MKKLFNNILVPVYADQASELAVERAMNIARHFICNLHIIYIENTSSPWKSVKNFFLKPSAPSPGVNKLALLREKYSAGLDAGIQLHTSLRMGKPERMITEYVIGHLIDLVVLGRSPQNLFPYLYSSLNINRLSRRTHCPVLSAMNVPGPENIRNIVIPVYSHLPIRKIIFASYLARTFNSRIHLISLSDNGQTTAKDAAYLSKSYQLLSDNTNLSVECHTMAGENIAASTLAYAEQIKADLIVVNPGKELKLKGFSDRFFPKLLVNMPDTRNDDCPHP